MTSFKTNFLFYVKSAVPTKTSYVHESASEVSSEKLCHQMGRSCAGGRLIKSNRLPILMLLEVLNIDIQFCPDLQVIKLLFL